MCCMLATNILVNKHRIYIIFCSHAPPRLRVNTSNIRKNLLACSPLRPQERRCRSTIHDNWCRGLLRLDSSANVKRRRGLSLFLRTCLIARWVALFREQLAATCHLLRTRSGRSTGGMATMVQIPLTLKELDRPSCPTAFHRRDPSIALG